MDIARCIYPHKDSRETQEVNMGYVAVISSCFGCGNIFSYNPHKVPSIRDGDDVRQPICHVCVERVNPLRVANGLAPIVPHPDAYEAIDESEL